jgi:hypothetical protein
MKTDQTHLHDALAELATTMSANPDRLRQIRDRVDRRRRRRMATGAAVSAGAVAAAVGIAMVPREPRSALQFNVEGPSLPACASLAAPAPTPTPPGKTPSAVLDPEPDLGRYKGTAVVTAVGTGTVTLGELVMGPVAVPPSGSIVMTVDATTTFENRGLSATASDVAVGQRVIFSAYVGTDGRDQLVFLELSADVVATTASEADIAAKKAEATANQSDKATDDLKAAAVPDVSKDEAPSDGVARGKAVIDAAPANNEVLVRASVDGGDLQAMRLLLGSATKYFRFETECTSPDLVVGTGMLLSAVPNGDGTYTATEIRIYE